MISFKDYQEQICETADTGLAAKASKSGISIGTLRKVYRRGVAAWNSGHRPGTTPQQWGMARVNSYIGKGKGTYGGADKDLHEEQLSESGGEVVWKKNNKHIEKYSDDAFALYVDGKKQKFFTSIEAAKSASDLSEGDTSKLPRVAKDKESGLPKKYVAGLSPSTAKARAAHFDKANKLSDSDPRAYTPAPGDANAKTKPSKHTLKYRAMYGENMDEEILEACWSGYKQVGVKKKGEKMVPNCVPVKEEIITERGADSKGYYRSTESGAGLTRKGAKHFGIQTAVTGKVKRGSKAAKRRKSFCARMGGMPGPMKDEKGRPTRKAASLRRWRCPS